jgi:hypothetical protein
MAYAPITYAMDAADELVYEVPLGQFTECLYGHTFEYSVNPETELHPKAHGGKNVTFPHKVWVTTPWKMDCGWRAALVLGTCVHIVTDNNGVANIQHWTIKRHNRYSVADMTQ